MKFLEVKGNDRNSPKVEDSLESVSMISARDYHSVTMFAGIKCSQILQNCEIHKIFMHMNILLIKSFPTSTNMPM